MRIYARLQDGRIAELVSTAKNIGDLFSPLLTWVDVSASPEVQVGWTYDGAEFTAPVPVATPAPPSLAQLQAQLTHLTQQLAALTKLN